MLQSGIPDSAYGVSRPVAGAMASRSWARQSGCSRTISHSLRTLCLFSHHPAGLVSPRVGLSAAAQRSRARDRVGLRQHSSVNLCTIQHKPTNNSPSTQRNGERYCRYISAVLSIPNKGRCRACRELQGSLAVCPIGEGLDRRAGRRSGRGLGPYLALLRAPERQPAAGASAGAYHEDIRAGADERAAGGVRLQMPSRWLARCHPSALACAGRAIPRRGSAGDERARVAARPLRVGAAS